MADVYDDAQSGPGAGRHGKAVASAINWTGGLLSLALILGTGVWGYKLLVRDVTGVPVVRALEGQFRVAPADPGGSSAAHQGLAVNSVAADGSAAGPSDTVILAPAPLNLSPEDLPVASLPRAVPDEALPDRAPPAQSNDMAAMNPEPEEAPVEIQDVPEDALATDRAVAEALAQDDTDLPEMTGDPTADALALAEAISEGVEPLSGTLDAPLRDSAGLVRSPRPPSRPERIAQAPVAQNVETVSAAPDIEVPVEKVAAGTRLVQLGAFESAEIARDQWDKIGERFAEYFNGKQRVVQRAQSNGKTFYRLRAMGFADLSDARRFCSTLMADKADCIPVLAR